MKDKVIQTVLEQKIIAIVRGVYAEDCLKLAQALYAGGIRLLEVTFDQKHPEHWHRTAGTIGALIDTLGERMLFGAGTVTTVEQVQLAKNAGACFIVSPDSNEAVIRETVAAGMVSMPGALSPSEILFAHRCGADFVKVFPAGNLGASYIKAIAAPVNHIRLLAVGGINERNAGDFLNAGAVGIGVGGNLVNKTWISQGEFDRISELASEFVRQCS